MGKWFAGKCVVITRGFILEIRFLKETKTPLILYTDLSLFTTNP